MSNCLNCGAALSGSYCADCGQAEVTGRLRVREILDDAIANLFNLDSKVPRTIVGLTREPGRVAAEYVAGRRASYVAPFRYCLIVVAAMLLLYTAFDFDPVNIQATTSSPDVEVQQRTEEIRIEIVRIVNARMNLVIFLALPLFGGIIRGLFRRSERNYAECMAFVFFVMGHVYLLGMPLGPLREVAPQSSVIVRGLLQVTYLSWAAIPFFDVSRWKAIWRMATASFAYMLVVAIIVAVLALPRVLKLLEETGVT